MNTFKQYIKRVEEAAGEINLSAKTLKKLLIPNRIIEKKIKLKLGGKLETLTAYRVQFNNARGPYKGGIRFHPEVDLAEVKALASAMALKAALIDIPLGGAKGGINFDSKKYDLNDSEKVARAWMRAMADELGPDKDIPAPDMYTDAQTMAYMLDEYEKITGQSQPGVITGKPLALGGSLGRESATAQGGVYVLEALIKKQKLKRQNLKVIIQGFGNSGFNAAKILHQLGYKIVGLADSQGGILNSEGFEPEIIKAKQKEFGSLGGIFKGVRNKKVKVVNNQEFLQTKCDILIPAALADQITKANAPEISAKIILELANGPTTSEADEILKQKKVIVIPDILANAGGVVVSYFEWVQNRNQWYWSAEEVAERLEKQMTMAFENVWQLSNEQSRSLRKAAYILALNRLASAIELRG